MHILASIDFGLPSLITQSWELWDYPESPYIVLHEYKVGGVRHEKRLYLLPEQIALDLLEREGWYSYRGKLNCRETRDIEV